MVLVPLLTPRSKSMKHQNYFQKGFTLIELLIVVAIIAILAAIAVPNFLEAQTRAKVTRSKSDLRTIAVAIESYTIDYNKSMPWWVAVNGKIGGTQLYLVTTPVSYITTVPLDAFQANEPQNSTNPNKNFSTFLGPIPNYFYYTDRYPTTGNFKLNGREGWTIRTMGPDLDFDLVGDPADMDGAVPYNGIYDSSNGTISNGDVLRSGGGVSFLNN